MLDTLKTFVIGRWETPAVYECRECGTTVDADTDECPSCESTEISRYEIR